MKKILFAGYSLDIGGIETALVTLLNYLIKKEEYEITLVLEKKQGIFLEELNSKVKIIEYKPDESKNLIKRKVKNLIKRIKFYSKYHNKFDFACSYATYSRPGSFIARTASKNSALWVHSEYMTVFKNDKEKYTKFFNEIEAHKFKKIIFVSQNAKKIFEENTDNQGFKYAGKVQLIHNLIDYEDIIVKSKEEITDIKKEDIYTFLNVGRHTEDDKKLSRIIQASKKLKEKGLKFRVILVGEGKETSNYKKMVSENCLENEIIFLGRKKNPYPYFKIADSFLLTSEYEGFPVVYIEAMILGLPIITTNVSDSKEIIENKYGIVVEKNIDSIYNAMEETIKNGLKCQQKFDYEKYNQEIENAIEKLIKREDEYKSGK